jgi:uncharacterized surface protein with fasciclin (FAS1) repeats
MQTFIPKWLRILQAGALILLLALSFTACKKETDQAEDSPSEVINERQALNEARQLEQTAAANAEKEGEALDIKVSETGTGRNIVEIALSNPNFSSLVAAVVKTGLAGALSDPSVNLTVFAPTNAAFAQLPAPFNNAANINAIGNPDQINFLRNVLLYHVVGAEVFSYQISNGSSSAPTLKPAGSANDNTIYFSKTFGLIRVNGQSDVIWANLNATNGVVHVINKVLLFPTQTIAAIAIGNTDFSALVAALVKTNLAGVFGNPGDFTVFAPTNAAFAKLPAPFNSAANISAINNPAQITALSNILRYHVVASRNFAWDLGILKRITTLADAPKNKITTILGYNRGWVKGDDNNFFSTAFPADILATNGVIHVIGDVLLPR